MTARAESVAWYNEAMALDWVDGRPSSSCNNVRGSIGDMTVASTEVDLGVNLE